MRWIVPALPTTTMAIAAPAAGYSYQHPELLGAVLRHVPRNSDYCKASLFPSRAPAHVGCREREAGAASGGENMGLPTLGFKV